MPKYIKREIADLNGKGQKQAYYRMETYGQLSFNAFVDECTKHGGMQKSSIVGVLAHVARELALTIAKGYTVKIDGLGTFGAKLGVRSDKEQDDFEEGTQRRNATTIQVTGISFRADKELISETDQACRPLRRGGEYRLHRSKYSPEKRAELARKYLADHSFMRIATYMQLTGLSRTTATVELRRLAADPQSGITSTGLRSAKVYVLTKK